MINVNLLPPEIKQDIAQSKKNHSAVGYLKKSILLVLVLLGVLTADYFYLNSRLSAASSNLTQKEESLKKYGELENKAKKLSDRITDIKEIIKNTNVWSGTINEITKIMPDGVFLTSVKMDSNAKVRASVSGKATSKKEVAALRDAMEQSGKFEYVDIETSNTSFDTTLNKDLETFTLSFSLTKGALK